TSRRGGLARNEADHGLGHPLLYELRGLLFVGAADLADHDHGIGRRVGLEGRQAVDEVRPAQGIAADADAGGLAEAVARKLVHDVLSAATLPGLARCLP